MSWWRRHTRASPDADARFRVRPTPNLLSPRDRDEPVVPATCVQVVVSQPISEGLAMKYARIRTTRACAALLSGILLVVPGCGGPTAQEEADFQNLFKSLGNLFDQLDTVKDDASA